MNLYNDLFTQSNWNERLRYNNVEVMTDINQAILGSIETTFIDNQSYVQFFNNSQSDVRLVVFGHTHKPKLVSFTNPENKLCVYANSGTWEDQKTRNGIPAVDQDTMKMDFVVITPTKSDSKKLQVGLYKYRYGKHELKAKKEVDL